MTTLTATAFKWSGTGYNSTYDTSHSVTLTDNDDHFQGRGDHDERVSIDGGAESSSLYNPYAIDVSFTDTSGDDHVETFYFFNTSGDWYFIPGPDSAFTEGAHLGTYQSHTVGWDYASAVCFANGTHILTAAGLTRVEDLVIGDKIRVLDGDTRRLRMHIVRQLSVNELRRNARLFPVRITRGALGNGLPRRDLRVSRQHRMLVNGPICTRMFGADAVLVPAHKLTVLPGCKIERPTAPMSYHHLIFDQHEVIFAEGAASESFYPGPEAIRNIPADALAEMGEIFGDVLRSNAPLGHARLAPSGKKSAKLLKRHAKNHRPVYDPVAPLGSRHVVENRAFTRGPGRPNWPGATNVV